MKHLKNLALALLIACGSFAITLHGETNSTALPPAPPELRPGPDDGRIIHTCAAVILEKYHYSQHPFDNDYSSKMLDHYIKSLDPRRIHFLQTDLDKFELWRNKLDDLTLKRGDTGPAYEIFNTFRLRQRQKTEHVLELLKTEKFTFDDDDRVLLNRKDKPAPKDLDEARQLWREQLRFEFLQEKLARATDKKKKDAKPPEAKKPVTKKPETKRKTDTFDVVTLTNVVVPFAKAPQLPIPETLVKRYKRILHIYDEMDNGDVFEIYVTTLAHVYDPHSDYFGKQALEQFKISMSLALFGIGAQLQMDEDGYCNVAQLMPGGPAIKSKLIRENERIVAVAQSNAPPVDIVGMNISKAVQLIRGPKGSEVRLTLESPTGADRHVVSLIRDEIPLESQQAKAKILDLPGKAGQTTRIGVIDLPSFYATIESPGQVSKSEPRFTSVDVATLITKMKEQDVRGIVLDLRRNGGGSLEEAVRLTGLFIKEGPVVQVVGRGGENMVDGDEDPAILWDGPLVVLTSRFSASASEIVAAALQDYGRALVVGDTTTHGKGTVQSLHQLENNIPRSALSTNMNPGALKFTIRKFYRANGGSTQFEGVHPDIILPSVINHSEDIGEKALDFAMPWDTNAPAKFEKVDRVAPFLATLKKNSDLRIAKSKDFAYVREDITEFQKRQKDKSISLNEKERLAEIATSNARTEARDKERIARNLREPKTFELTIKNAILPGLPPAVTHTNAAGVITHSGSDTTTQIAAPDPRGTDEEEADEKPPAIDPMLEETQSILVDYLNALGKVVTAKK